MSFRLLADENVEYRVVHRLRHYGHDTEHVDFIAELGKGADDHHIARYSLNDDRLILSSDSDFLTDFEDNEYRGLLFIPDETLDPGTVAEIVHSISLLVEQGTVHGVYFVTRAWL